MQRFSLYGVHKRDYQESVTIGQTDARTHAHTHRQTPDKVIPMCRYASQATQHARTHTQTDAGQSDPYVPLCFAGDTKSIHQVQ